MAARDIPDGESHGRRRQSESQWDGLQARTYHGKCGGECRTSANTKKLHKPATTSQEIRQQKLAFSFLYEERWGS